MDKKKWIRHLPLYILELVVLAAAIGALYFVMHATKAQKQQIKEGDIAVNEEIRQQFQNDTAKDQEQDPQKPNLSVSPVRRGCKGWKPWKRQPQ